ncbi:MAG: protein TolR [Pseudomonadota bacterium]
MAGFGSDDKRLLSEINVTPFVDVMLVLLIIFMVAAPMMIQGMDVDLPRTTAKPLENREKSIVLTIDRDQNIFVENVRIPQEKLRSTLKSLKEQTGGREILLRADKSVSYGFVVQVLALMKELGIEKLGMITDPLDKEQR